MLQYVKSVVIAYSMESSLYIILSVNRNVWGMDCSGYMNGWEKLLQKPNFHKISLFSSFCKLTTLYCNHISLQL
jgi:hypothetical protein